MKLTSAVNMDRINLSEAIPLEWPLVIYIETSGYCNFRCRFCPQGSADASLKKENMSLALFKKIADELSNERAKAKKIRLCGLGECLINTEFPMMLEYLNEKDAACCIELVTNGVLLTKNIAPVIAESCDIVRFSIEGLTSDEYAVVAGRKIDYQQLLDNISCLHSVPGRKAKICVKIHGNSIKSQGDLETFYNRFEPIADEVSVEQLCNMWPDYDSSFVVNEDKFRFSVDGENYSGLVRRNVCPQIFKAVQIYSNGDVVPCCFDWERRNTVGNIADAPLRDIWKGGKLKALQLAHLKLLRGGYPTVQ